MVDLNALPLPDLHDHLFRREPGRSQFRRLIELARDEDLGRGDITSWLTIPADAAATGAYVARQPGILAGISIIAEALTIIAPACRIERHVQDGQAFNPGQSLATIRGPARQVLEAERLTLNLLSRLCGVATLTARYVQALGPNSRAKVFDTRKTTPGLRLLEKFAVRCGGGMSHRLGLFDAVLIKDNHIARVPAKNLGAWVRDAAVRARAASDTLQFIEVEVGSVEQLNPVLADAGDAIDMVLLDNMNVSQLRECVKMRDRLAPRVQLEASGGVTLDTIRDLGATGVERISVGAITHQATGVDIGLDFT